MGSGVSVAVEAGVGRSEPALGVNDRCMRNAATGHQCYLFVGGAPPLLVKICGGAYQ